MVGQFEKATSRGSGPRSFQALSGTTEEAGEKWRTEGESDEAFVSGPEGLADSERLVRGLETPASLRHPFFRNL